MLGKLVNLIQKLKVHLLIPYTKFNSKYIKYFSVRPVFAKYTEENIGRMFLNIGFRGVFNKMT